MPNCPCPNVGTLLGRILSSDGDGDDHDHDAGVNSEQSKNYEMTAAAGKKLASPGSRRLQPANRVALS